MPVIKVLTEAQAARIAAGEVIERPVSVIKELLENSLDSGADTISIDIRGGGSESIVVADNGCGMSLEDLPLAFLRFSTSKIEDDSDLVSISTLGFRGEALPSIASVSEVEVFTRTHNSERGSRYLAQYGTDPILEEAGASPGTLIKVSNLFKNVPVRRKFLSSNAAETGRIQRLISEMTLVNPCVTFALVVDGKRRLHSRSSNDKRSAFAAVYGRDLSKKMLELDPASDASFRVEGLISPPEVTRKTRSYMTVSVNGRLVKNKRIFYAIREAYRSYIPESVHPIAVLDLTIPHFDVDVNVHPSKQDIKFLREDLIVSSVLIGLRKTLEKDSPTPGLKSYYGPRSSLSTALPTERLNHWSMNLHSPAVLSGTDSELSMSPKDRMAVNYPPSLDTLESIQKLPGKKQPKQHSKEHKLHREILPALRIIGQAESTYIVAEAEGGVFLIDQHAAHERVLYEQLSDQIQNSAIQTQTLLAPLVIEPPRHYTATLEEKNEELSAAGFSIEPFGEGTWILREVPFMLASNKKIDSFTVLSDMLDLMTEDVRPEPWIKKLTASMACHSSIRAGKILTIDESLQLITQLEKCEQPRTCAHGRPTMLYLSSTMLERNFGRR